MESRLDNKFTFSSLKFLVIGDWGTNSKQLTDVVDALAKQAEKQETDVIISSGDNFYYTGVQSERDSRFKTTYEDVFNVHESLKNRPFWPVLGNHDHYGSAGAQIRYSNNSKTWHFPAPFYSRSLMKNNRLMLIMLDTSPFVKDPYGYVARLKGYKRQPQIEWFDKTMDEAAMDNQFILVVGHHNLHTASLSGKTNTKDLREALMPSLKKHKNRLLAYVSGHEHVLMHLQQEGIDHIVSGSGSQLETIQRPARNLRKEWLKEKGILTGECVKYAETVAGFFQIEFNSENGKFGVYAFDSKNNSAYQYEKIVSL